MGSTASLDRSPRKNWLESSGQSLPGYVREIARSIEREQGVPLSRAISLAIGAVKRWARGGGNVNGDTRAKAAAAVAHWEKAKAANRARQVSTSHMAHADTVELADDGSVLTRRATGDGLLVLSQVTDTGTVVELARYVRTPAGAKRYGRPIGALIEPGAGRARGGKTSGGGNGSGRAAAAGAGGRVTSSRGGGTSSGRAPSREERRAEAGRKLNRWAEQGREQALRREQKKIDRWKGQQDGALRTRQKQVARTWLTNQANGVPATDKRQRDLRAEQNAIGAELKRRGQAGSGGEITSTTSGDRLARMGTMEQRAALRGMSDAELRTAKAEMQGRVTAGKPNPTLDAINAERARRAGSTTPAAAPAAPSTPAAPAAPSAASGDRSLADRMRNLDDAQLKAMDDALDKKGGAPSERHAAIKAERARRTGSGKPAPSPAPAAKEQGGLADLGRPGVGPEQREQILRGLSDNDLARASAAMDAAVEQTKDQPDVRSVLVGRRGEVEREQMRRKTAATAGKRAETGGRTERAENAAARPAPPAPSTTPSRPKPDGPAKPAEQRPTAKATATAPSPARPATSPTLNPGERANPAVVAPRRGGTPQGRPMETGTRRMGGADRAPEPAGAFPTAPQGVTRKVTDLPGLSEQQLIAERADAAQVLRWHVRNGTPRTSTDYADARSRQRALEAENGRRETADRSAGVTPAQRQRATADAGGTPSQVRVDALLGKHLTAKGLKGQAGDFAAYSPAEMRAAADQLDRTRNTAPYKKAAADLRRMADTYEASAADRAAGGSGNVSVLPTRPSTTPGPARTAAPAGESRAERNARLLQQERAQDTGRAAERTADPKSMTPEQRTRIANRMRMESTAADTPAQASEMRRRADELEAMNTGGTVSPIRPADTPRPPWGDGPAMRTGDTGYEQAFRAASEKQKAAESDLRYRQERVQNESFKAGDRLVVEGFRTPAAVVEITQDGDRFTKTGNELKVRDVATGREFFVLRDNVKAREVNGETGMQTVTRLRAERLAALGAGGDRGGSGRGRADDVAERAEARAAVDQDRPAPSGKQARAKLARDRVAALEGTGALSLRAARVKGVDDDGLLAMLEVMNSRKGPQKLRGDVVGEMQRRGMPLPAARPATPSPTQAADGLGDNPMAARARATGKARQSPVRDMLDTPDHAERAEKMRNLSRSSRLKARRAMDAEQIDATIQALREVKDPPNVIRQGPMGIVTELQDELRNRDDYDRDTGLSKQGAARRARPAAPATRTERDTPGTAANVQARQDAQGRANQRAQRGLFPEDRPIPNDPNSLFGGDTGTGPGGGSGDADVDRLAALPPGPRGTAIDDMDDDQVEAAAAAAAVRANRGAGFGSLEVSNRLARERDERRAQSPAEKRRARELRLYARMTREIDPARRKAIQDQINAERFGPTEASHTSTQGVVDMSEPFGGKRAVPFGKKKAADAAGSGKPGATHADLTDEQLAAAVAKAKTAAKGASGKAAQSAAQTLVKLKAEQSSRGKKSGGKKSTPPWVKTSNAGGAALDLSNEVPARAVPSDRAGKAAAALARMGL